MFLLAIHQGACMQLPTQTDDSVAANASQRTMFEASLLRRVRGQAPETNSDHHGNHTLVDATPAFFLPLKIKNIVTQVDSKTH
jgi:hypothetical protein